jgi:hypothetical protein
MASKVGSIVLATDQGLGYLAKDFFDHGLIQKVFIRPHTSRANHFDWYPDTAKVDSPEALLNDCETLLFFEEVWHWPIIVKARERGIKTVLMPMYECTRSPLPYEPDLIICPSSLDFQYFKEKGSVTQLNVPVEVEWRERTRAMTFVHNAGNGGLGGRNGTKQVLEAMKYIKKPIRLILRSQVPIAGITDPRIDYREGQFPSIDLWKKGDVFLFPEKFNGLSLPLQEALAAGMLVMAGNRFPMNEWLPKEPLIPVQRYSKERISVEFDCAHFSPRTIAATVEEWYNKDITEFSHRGRVWAEQNSWTKLKEKYETALSR